MTTELTPPHPDLPADVVRAAAARRGRPHVYDSIEAKRTALVVVDLQRAFMDVGAPAEVPAARRIIPTVNRLAAGLRAAGGTVAFVQATFDRAGWPMFFHHMVAPELAQQMLAALQVGAELHGLAPDLERKPEDLVVP